MIDPYITFHPRHVKVFGSRLPIATDDIVAPILIEILIRLIYILVSITMFVLTLKVWLAKDSTNNYYNKSKNGVQTFHARASHTLIIKQREAYSVYYYLLLASVAISLISQCWLLRNSMRGNISTPHLRSKVPFHLSACHILWALEALILTTALVAYFITGYIHIPELYTSNTKILLAYIIALVLGVVWLCHLLMLFIPMLFLWLNPFGTLSIDPTQPEELYHTKWAVCLFKCYNLTTKNKARPPVTSSSAAPNCYREEKGNNWATFINYFKCFNRSKAYRQYSTTTESETSSAASAIKDLAYFISNYFIELSQFCASDVMVGVLLYSIFWKAKCKVYERNHSDHPPQTTQPIEGNPKLDPKAFVLHDHMDQEDLLLYATVSSSLYGWLFYAYVNTAVSVFITTTIYYLRLTLSIFTKLPYTSIVNPFKRIYRLICCKAPKNKTTIIDDEAVSYNSLRSNSQINQDAYATLNSTHSVFPIIKNDSTFHANYYFINKFVQEYLRDQIKNASKHRENTTAEDQTTFKTLYLNMKNNDFMSPFSVSQYTKLSIDGVSDRRIIIAVRGSLSISDAWTDVTAAEEIIPYEDLLLYNIIGRNNEQHKSLVKPGVSTQDDFDIAHLPLINKQPESLVHVIEEHEPLITNNLQYVIPSYLSKSASQLIDISKSTGIAYQYDNTNYSKQHPLGIHKGVAAGTSAILADLLMPLKDKLSLKMILKHHLDPDLPLLDYILSRHPGHKLIVTGHSLGAGIASVLTMYINHRYNHQQVLENLQFDTYGVVYSPPGGCVSPKLSAVMQQKLSPDENWSLSANFKGIISLAPKRDIICRLSVSTLLRFRDTIKEILEINQNMSCYHNSDENDIEAQFINFSAYDELKSALNETKDGDIIANENIAWHKEKIAVILYVKYVMLLPKYRILYKLGLLRFTQYFLRKLKIINLFSAFQKKIKIKIFRTHEKDYVKNINKYIFRIQESRSTEENHCNASLSLTPVHENSNSNKAAFIFDRFYNSVFSAPFKYTMYMNNPIHVKCLPGTVFLIDINPSYVRKRDRIGSPVDYYHKKFLVRYNYDYHHQQVEDVRDATLGHTVRLFNVHMRRENGGISNDTFDHININTILSDDYLDYILISKSMLQDHLPDKLLAVLRSITSHEK